MGHHDGLMAMRLFLPAGIHHLGEFEQFVNLFESLRSIYDIGFALGCVDIVFPEIIGVEVMGGSLCKSQGKILYLIYIMLKQRGEKAKLALFAASET